jgi:hypothetical protein
MKPRVLATQKILVAVVTATAAAAVGCVGPTTEPTPATADSMAFEVPAQAPAPPAQPTQAAPHQPELLPAAATVSAPAPTEAASEVQVVSANKKPIEPEHDSKLHRLREELFDLRDEKQVLAQKAHFRPLCDADGYPVVGNVMRKASGYQASRFCAAIRENKGR